MSKIKLITFFCAIVASYFCEALECGIHMDRNQELQTTILKCIKNNKTLQDLRELGSYSSESDSSSSYSDDRTGVDDKIHFRTKRSVQRKDLQNQNVTLHNESNSGEQNKTSDEIVSENCVIHCIFTNLNLTDASGFPAHSKLVSGLMKNVTGREMRDFLQDSTDDCFQEMSREIATDPCEYSTKLLTCLADRGKINCADWPVGDLPFPQ